VVVNIANKELNVKMIFTSGGRVSCADLILNTTKEAMVVKSNGDAAWQSVVCLNNHKDQKDLSLTEANFYSIEVYNPWGKEVIVFNFDSRFAKALSAFMAGTLDLDNRYFYVNENSSDLGNSSVVFNLIKSTNDDAKWRAVIDLIPFGNMSEQYLNELVAEILKTKEV
jgi:hypothetical protein